MDAVRTSGRCLVPAVIIRSNGCVFLVQGQEGEKVPISWVHVFAPSYSRILAFPLIRMLVFSFCRFVILSYPHPPPQKKKKDIVIYTIADIDQDAFEV